MKIICAWCKSEMGNDGAEDSRTSHTICRDCRNWMRGNERGYPLVEYLDKLPPPILLVDGEGVVQLANKAACRVLGKDLEQIRGKAGGNVMECAYARLPEGCGQTIHCKACAIRLAVIRTHSTGEDLADVEAYQEIMVNEKTTRMKILLSTHKFGEVVFLRLDAMTPALKN
ncbi:MAG: PAS domain-containing protein [Chitinivibrionales bacterium]|nr:PAS domain-containing protein [Chitinivibrionales bacterium]MBD3358154.1 PAS domain-containing protein [Chitinivibrionales bacterium]